MIDIDPASTCRICLDDGAIYPIFESTDEIEGVYAKLATCIRDKIENIEGYPRNICLNCKNTSDTICSFVSQFEETCRILKKKIVEVKTEQQDFIDLSDNDFDNNDDCQEPLAYEQEIDKLPMKPKPEKRDPTELLESLKHLTVKKIKVENESGETSSVVRKRGRPRKQAAAPTKSVKITKVPRPEKKPVIPVPVVKKEMKIPPLPPPETKTIKDVVAEKALREKGIDSTLTQTTYSTALCDACGTEFISKAELIRHIRKTHTKKTFKCSKCPKAYCSQSVLNDHEKTHGERNRLCETCGKVFVLEKHVRRHIRVVHMKIRPAKASHQCQFCERTFFTKRCVIVHERSVHTGDRPEVCHVCGRRFYDSMYLREHMRVHTGHSPFKCPVCHHGFNRLSYMKTHLHRHHKISDLTPDILSNIKPSYLECERPAKCDVCDSSFLDNSYLAEHMRLHTGETPFKCPVCGRGYAQRGNMKSHMRNHKISELTTDVLAKIKPNYFKFMRP